MNSINAIPASIRHAFVMADGSPLEDSWLCHIYADDLAKQDEYPSLADKIERILKEEELLSLRNVATGLLMFLAKYYNKVKQTNPPKFVLNSENKEISIFIRGNYCGYVRFSVFPTVGLSGSFTLKNFVIGSPYIFRRRMTGNMKTKTEQPINLSTNVGVNHAVKLATEYWKALDVQKILNNYNSVVDNVISNSTTDSYTYIWETFGATLDNYETRKKLYGSIVGDISTSLYGGSALAEKENSLWLLYALCKCGDSGWSSDSFMSAEELSELAKSAVNNLERFIDRMDALLKERQKNSFIRPIKSGKLIIHVTPDNSVHIYNDQTTVGFPKLRKTDPSDSSLVFYENITLAPAWISRVTAMLDVVNGDYIRSVGVRLPAFPFEKFTGGDFKAIGTYYAIYPEQEC